MLIFSKPMFIVLYQIMCDDTNTTISEAIHQKLLHQIKTRKERQVQNVVSDISIINIKFKKISNEYWYYLTLILCVSFQKPSLFFVSNGA